MKQGLSALNVPFMDNISIENLIFKFFIEFGMIERNSIRGEFPRCIVGIKTLGPKLIINSMIRDVSRMSEGVFVEVPSQ